jgi:hypothetical protein
VLTNESYLTNGLLSYKVKSIVINEIVAVISGGWNLIIGRLARTYQEPLGTRPIWPVSELSAIGERRRDYYASYMIPHGLINNPG